MTYSLEGRDAPSFDINETNGQLRTRSGITLLVGTTYTVTVVADDTKDTTRIAVSIEATAAPPNNPPVFSEGSSTTRTVSATAPGGHVDRRPGASGHQTLATRARRSRCRQRRDSLEGTNAASFDINTGANGQLRTVAGVTLTPNTYTVEVVANDGSVSSRITVTITVTPNRAPVFSEGTATTRSVREDAASGTDIGNPVTATDADPGATLTYRLEGVDAGSFGINPANGQIRASAALDARTKATYTVVVVASDGSLEARVTVTITVIVLNNPPAFANASTTRSVSENSPVGTNVGSPVAATDVDQDTLTYTLGGADVASFTIVGDTGHIQTAAVLDEETRSSYTVTVTANDGTEDSAPITVTISVTDVTFGCATAGAVAASNRGLVSDCEALLEARNKLEDGGARLNWWHGTPIAGWEGITLRGTPERVAWVDLRAKGLSGAVPAELGQVTMLTELNLRSNDLTGSIPPELNRLTRLEKLLLHNNRLTGAIPDLSRLRNLKMLWLSGRDMALTGGVPTWLNTMSGLEELTVWGNDLGGTIPYLAGMSSLKRLDIRANGLTGSVPAWLGDMDSLGILYLASNDLSGEIPEELSLLTGLVRMWLDRNDLTGSIPAELGSMANLRTLNLRDNQLTGSIPPELSRLSNLVHLRLHNNMLTGSIPPELGRLSKVTQFYLSGHNMALTGSIPPELGDLDSVMHLSLWGNNLTGPIPPELDDLGDTLTRLRLGGNTGLTGCVPRSLSGATDATDLSDAGLSICP